MAKSSSWKAYLVVCGVVIFLTLFMLGNVGLPAINQGVNDGQRRGGAAEKEVSFLPIPYHITYLTRCIMSLSRAPEFSLLLYVDHGTLL